MSYSAQFKNYLFGLNTSKVTLKNYASDVNHFIRWFETELNSAFSPDLVTLETIEYYKKTSSKTLSASSLKRHISSLRRFFNFLKLEGHIVQNPFDFLNSNADSSEIDPYRLRDFKNFLYVYNSSALTIKNYINDVRQFLKWAEEVTKVKDSWKVEDQNLLPKLTPQLLAEYKQRLLQSRFSPRSINRKLSSLRKYLSWASEAGLIAQRGNPFASELNAETAGFPEAFSNVKNRRSLSFPSTPATRVAKPRTYSKFPPLRLIQKTFAGLNFLLDSLLINPLASSIRLGRYTSWKLGGRKVFQELAYRSQKLIVRNLSKEFYAPLSLSIAYYPLHKRVFHHLRYTRPKWYKTYHTYSVSHYFHLAILLVCMSAIGFAVYDSLHQKRPAEGQVLALRAESPNRILSFQGLLTDSSDTPITSSTYLRFLLYDSPTASGSALHWQEVNNVTPDSDGVFSVILGKTTAIPSYLFAEHAGLWLGISVGDTPELTPRQQLATVPYASNSETLQGLRPITQSDAGTANVVLALDSAGDLTIGGTATPTFQATGGEFTISGNVLSLTTLAGSDSNIVLNPDDIGKIDLRKPIQNSTHSNNIPTAAGAVEIDDLFAILATSSGQSAFTVDQNSTGPIISASSSGTARFTVDNSGNTTISGNFLSALTASRDLGSSSVRWNNLWVQTINATGTNTSGQASFTYDPADTTYAQGTVLLNPTSAGANELLLGAGIGGVERASIDTEGDLVLGFAGGTVTRNSNPLTVYNHGTTQVASIDTSGNLTLGTTAATTGSLRFPNNSTITMRNVANNADLQFAFFDTGNNIVIGDTTASKSQIVQINGNGVEQFWASGTVVRLFGSNGLSINEGAGVASFGSGYNVGIGVTSGLIGKVNIQSADSGVSTVSGASDELVIEGSGNAGLSILTPNTANAQISFGDPQDNNVGNINYLHSENRMQFRTAGLSTGLDIDSSGEVGIGTTTPGNKLHVVSTATSGSVAKTDVTDTATGVLSGIMNLELHNTDTTVNNQAQLVFSSKDTAGSTIHGADIAAVFTTHAVNDGATDLRFSTRPSTVAMTEKMRITSTGKVGINTADLSGNNQLRVVQSTSGTIAAGKFENGSLSAVNLAIGSGYGMSILCEESNSIYCFQAGAGTSNITTMWGGGGWSIGNAATNQGAGTINVTGNIYKNGSAYNNPDYAFEKYFTGKIVRFADREGASDYPGLMPLEEVESYAKTNYQLPRVADKRGIFDRTDILLEKVEEIYLYLFDFNRRILSLESKTCVQSESSSDFGLIKTICSQSTIEKLADSGTYAVKNYLGEVATGGQILAEVVVGTLRAGYIEAQEIAAGSIETNEIISPVAEIARVETDVITPLSSEKVIVKLEDNSSNTSAESVPQLEIQNSSGSAVASIDDEGNASFSGTLNSFGLVSETASISGTLTTKNLIAENIESSILTLKDQISSISGSLTTSDPTTTYVDIASYSAQLAYVDTIQAEVGTFMQGLFAVGPSSLSDVTVFGQLSIGTTLILADNSINVLGSDLQIQPLGLGGVSFLAGKVIIDTNGNLETLGDATIRGILFTNVLSPIPGSDLVEFKDASGSAVASINTKGDATFRKLNLSLIEPAFALSETELIATGSAGIATISANFKEVTIQNKLVTENSLIYISPVGTPSAQVPFLLRQNLKDELTGEQSSFTVGTQDILDNSLPFNWLIIN